MLFPYENTMLRDKDNFFSGENGEIIILFMKD